MLPRSKVLHYEKVEFSISFDGGENTRFFESKILGTFAIKICIYHASSEFTDVEC